MRAILPRQTVRLDSMTAKRNLQFQNRRQARPVGLPLLRLYSRFASGFACHGSFRSDPRRRGRGFWLQFVNGDVNRARRGERASVPSAVSLPQPHSGKARHQVQFARIREAQLHRIHLHSPRGEQDVLCADSLVHDIVGR
jgi:hypothetical protein